MRHLLTSYRPANQGLCGEPADNLTTEFSKVTCLGCTMEAGKIVSRLIQRKGDNPEENSWK